MKRYWHSLQDRERLVLLAGGLAATLLLLYLLVWEPLTSAQAQLEIRVGEQTQLLDWMKAAARQVEQHRSRSSQDHSSQSLLARVESSARKAGLASHIKRIQPDGNHLVHVWFDGVNFDQALPWLAELLAEPGLSAQDLALDRADAPGRVNLRLVLRDSRS